ncbi:hypothetical protein [Undibacterium sp. YM2]|uniref:hypothetical protein n=1 Tax=Undibacterium sp. YM2 TaxID=2058625 RepID=UPI00138A4EA4|nr:hypothetical protein [Undibacterium sp. YM2]
MAAADLACVKLSGKRVITAIGLALVVVVFVEDFNSIAFAISGIAFIRKVSA